MRIVAADSGSAILDEWLEPVEVVATAAVLVEEPFRQPSLSLTEAAFKPVERGYELIVDELRLCSKLLEAARADVVHLDLSLQGAKVHELDEEELRSFPISARARRRIEGLLPDLRELASKIREVHGIDVLALGKDSVPVRIAELTAGASSIVYAAERALREGRKVLVGLPIGCEVGKVKRGIVARSLLPAEHDLLSVVGGPDEVLGKVRIRVLNNPKARGFRMVSIEPHER